MHGCAVALFVLHRAVRVVLVGGGLVGRCRGLVVIMGAPSGSRVLRDRGNRRVNGVVVESLNQTGVLVAISGLVGMTVTAAPSQPVTDMVHRLGVTLLGRSSVQST